MTPTVGSYALGSADNDGHGKSSAPLADVHMMYIAIADSLVYHCGIQADAGTPFVVDVLGYTALCMRVKTAPVCRPHDD